MAFDTELQQLAYESTETVLNDQIEKLANALKEVMKCNGVSHYSSRGCDHCYYVAKKALEEIPE